MTLSELEDALDLVAAHDVAEAAAYVSRTTGEVYCWSANADLDELPEDLETSDDYVALPDRRSLDLGTALVFRFTDERMPAAGREVRAMFGARGAYGRFKGLLERQGLLDEWYLFEAAATRLALREWCAAEGLELEPEDPGRAG